MSKWKLNLKPIKSKNVRSYIIIDYVILLYVVLHLSYSLLYCKFLCVNRTV